jgi:purine-nucleoside phosphorylase
MGMEVFALSVITDECFPDALAAVDLTEIITIANKAQPKLTLIIKKLIEKI